MLIVKFIPILAPAVIAIWQVGMDKRKKVRDRWILSLVTGACAFISCLIVWANDQDATKWRASTTSHLDRIEGRVGGDDAARRYIEAMQKLIQKETKEKTGTAAEKFFSSETERNKLRKEASLANEKLLLAYEMRFRPVLDLVLAKFDAWIEEARKRGIKVDVEAQNVAPVKVETGRPVAAVRTATFEGGSTVLLQIFPAIVESAQLVQHLHVQMPFRSRDGSFGEVWTMDMYEKEYAVGNIRPTKFSYKPYQGADDNPINDQQWTTVLEDSLNQVMGYIIEESTTGN